MDFFEHLFSADFMPHGHCYFWKPEILWLHLISDVIIGVSYYSIPLALLYLVRKRKDLAFHWVFVMFATFIFACGTTHFVAIWTIWHGAYRIEGVVKLITALVSLPTALVVWPLVPKVLRFASPNELEQQVAERTRELTESNSDLKQKSEILERFHNLTVDRELEMIRLKLEVNGLLTELARPSKYETQEAEPK